MRIKNFIRKNYKIVIGFIIGGIVFGGIGVYAVTTKEVAYDNTTSNLTSNTLQGAIDELNTKATTKIAEAEKKCPDGYICNVGSGNKVSTNNSNILKAYSYNSSTCVTGEESTCKETNCINYTGKSSCPAGTIIKYKVNSSTTKYFYVLHDDGGTMTLQQRENTVYNTAWYSSADNTKGPLTILPALESATSGWTNVNNQTYTMGTTNFNGTNAYTGCNYDDLNCTTNAYTLDSRTARARMITLQEAKAVGCTTSTKSCPVWMYNYLNGSASNGGTVNDTTGGANYAYWLMSATSSSSSSAWNVRYVGNVNSQNAATPSFGARAVVVVNK